MNERIQELVKQARRYAEDKQNDPMRVYTLDVFTEKFAELVVKECAEIANKHMIDCEDINYGVGTVIRRTFGVE